MFLAQGLAVAVAELLLSAEHRVCARHIYTNWDGKNKGPKIYKQFWIIAKSTIEADFKENLEELQRMSPKDMKTCYIDQVLSIGIRPSATQWLIDHILFLM